MQEQIDARLERGLRALAAQGMDPEQMRKLDFARLRTAQRDSAIAEVKTSVLLDRIAQEENITVSDEELDNELQLAALQSREPLDTLKVRLTQDGGLARIREQLRREKTALHSTKGCPLRAAEQAKSRLRAGIDDAGKCG